ncbi:protein SMG5 [Manduca sexta]|uniref:protein SMG5 n=1 Tax=Manduca sexta TaxID=7130 RepID=UPI00188EE505|nr:protein SMG5 [Manduca sexta]
MKNGCNEILEAKIVERNERAKKLYRYVTDVARRVGELTSASQSIVELFSIKIEVQRQKLRDYCEKLLFLDPLNYGKKTLELLWRKVYYDTITAAKKLRESVSDSDSFLYSHIECGIGHFSSLIERIQTEFTISFKEHVYVAIHDEEEVQEFKTATDDELQFGRSALHSCFIYLGDLSRYQVEIFQAVDPSIAARYYLLAAHIELSLGMPYNQLGNLYLDKNYNLDSVCYYIQCLNCASPFEGAMGNLTKIFEKNIQFDETCNVTETLTQTEHVQNTIVNFLSLIEIWYLGKSDTNIPQRCNALAHEFKLCMGFSKPSLPDINKNYNDYIQAIDEENTNPTYLNSNIIQKIVQICLFTHAKMIETDESKAFACKAFTLALLSQLLQKLLKQLNYIGLINPASKYIKHSAIQENESDTVNKKIEQDLVPEIDDNKVNGDTETQENDITKQTETEGDHKHSTHNGDTKNNIKRTLTKRRRRRRVASSESSDMSDAETGSSDIDSNNSGSDDENLSDSSFQSEDEKQSEESDNEKDDEDLSDKKVESNAVPKTDSKTNENEGDACNKNSTVNNYNPNKSMHELNVSELQNFLQGDNILASIKLLQDWVLLEKDLILSCGDSGESLFQCVVDLLNIFTFYFNIKGNEEDGNKCHILVFAKSMAQKLKLEYKKIPLPEDINLRGTNICKFDKDAAEWQILDKYKLTVYEENIIRILNFIDFGNQIAKIVPRIRFNRSLKVFYLKKSSLPKLNTKLSHKRSREWHNSKKQHAESSESGLLRQLGRLWLASQVRELERSGQSATPALLVVDTAALNKHLRRVKQLVRARNFVLLIPTIVLQELDNLKREQSTARDAIRWLELQLRSGSRFLRAQRPGQTKPLPLLKYPRKAPPHIYNFIQILEFCNHFIADEKHGNGDSDNSLQGKSTPLLILLVGGEPGSDEQYKEFSVTGAAQSAGITVEQIGDFYTKWRQTVHKNGKKR